MQAFGATQVNDTGPKVWKENVVKESLESFLRNRFIKG
jgi:hypothetical protein